MRIRRAPACWVAFLALVSCAPASAQSTPPPPPIQGATTTIPGLTLADTITQMARPVGATHVGEALGLATQLQVATAPFGASSGGFVFKLDPSTGLQVRTATTFGPSFAERALTSGEGQVNAGVNFMSATFDRLDTLPFNGLQLRTVTATSPQAARSGIANLAISSSTVVVSGRMGVTDALDVGVVVPVVTVKVNGTTSLRDGNSNILTFAQGGGVASGLGDIAGLVKYRFLTFGSGEPDPGGLAVMATMRFPTGDTDNLRGLGITRTLVTFIASGGQGRFRPHVNGGFEYWSKGVAVTSDSTQSGTVTARHQVEYDAGLEFEAAPKFTLLLDLLGGKILGGGKVGFQTDPLAPAGTTLSQSAVSLPEGIRRLELAPGMKVNLKGKLLLSLNALIALQDGGLHARITPMAGIDLTLK
jgi:hypothetical protein